VCYWLQAVAVFLSAFTMLAISLDRYRAVIFPLRPRLTPRLAAAVIAVTWFLAMATSLPVAIFSRIVMRPDRLGVPRAMCLEEWPGGTSQQRTYSMAVMVLQYFLPLAILLFTYINIGVVIWTKKAPGEAESTRDQRLAASKRKVF
jgi:neuropeptide Y receptor